MKKISIILLLGFSIQGMYFKSFGQGIPADSLFVAYKQDSANNCASIALIKANLNVFGFDGLFKETAINDTTEEFFLKDSSKIILTNAELELARTKFNADTSSATTPYLQRIVRISLVCYAIMAKKFHSEFPFSDTSYQKNLEHISAVSFNVKYGTNLLGTGDYFFIPRWRYVSIIGKKGAVVWSPGHTVFAYESKCDMRGNSSNFSKHSRSWWRFWGRMWIDVTSETSNVQ
jgi:hypothetical protein